MSLGTKLDTLLKQFQKTYATHNRIEVSRSAILHNIALFEKLGGHPVIPVLKGNAYGHGIVQVATALKGKKLPYIAVDGYFEALRIREVSSQPVLVMGAIKPENFKRLKYNNFTFVVGDKETIHALGKTGKRVKVHLECNTGMNRYGAKPHEMADLSKLVLEYKNLTLEGVMSHLADSDGDDPATVDIAVERFDQCVEQVRAAGGTPTIFHVAQSAGSLKVKSKYANTVRVGIGTYGLNPFPYTHALQSSLKDLRPALRLVSTITKVIELDKGDKVSYNYQFTAPKKMRIGVLPIGYFEGAWSIARGAGLPSGSVKIGNTFTPIVGRVCMNHLIINLDGLNAQAGEEVVVYSNNPTDKNAVDCIAKNHHIFNYTLLTALSADNRRILVD